MSHSGNFWRRQIKQIGDLERIISKVAVGRIHPRELVQLKNALAATGTPERAL